MKTIKSIEKDGLKYNLIENDNYYTVSISIAHVVLTSIPVISLMAALEVFDALKV